MKVRRPILVGGLGLSFSLWALQSWHDSLVQLSEYALLTTMAVGGSLWLLRQNTPQQKSKQLDGIVKEFATVENAIAQTQATINQLASAAANHQALYTLQEKLAQLQQDLNRDDIKLAITGGKSVGKTSLIAALNSITATPPQLSCWEAPPLFRQISEQADTDTLASLRESDLVLFLTNSDLTDSEFQILEKLKTANQPYILLFNKQDQYSQDERARILLSLKQRIPQNVIATTTSPIVQKRRKHYSNGTIEEWMETLSPDIQQLTQALNLVVTQQKQALVWTTITRKAKILQQEAKNHLNQIRRDASNAIIEQYQWITAAATFANPLPALDILATAAINTQMVIELGNIYQQQFSWEQAQTVAANMGSLMLKLGLVEVSTKAITTILKSNALTFVAGGVVQGVSAAYLTKVAGLSLVAYFEQQEIALDSSKTLNLEKLRTILSSVFETNQLANLSTFVKEGVKRLLPLPQAAS